MDQSSDSLQLSLVTNSLRFYAMIDQALEEGLELQCLLDAAGMSGDDFHRKPLTIDIATAQKLSAYLVPLMTDSDFALRLGGRLNITSYGLHTMVILSQRDIRSVVKFCVDYQQLLGLGPIADHVKAQKGEIVRFKNLHESSLPDSFYRFLIETIFASMLSCARFIKGDDFQYAAVRFSYRKPCYGDAYEEIFQCPVYFEQDRCELEISNQNLNHTLVTSNPIIAESGIALFQDLLAQYQRSQSMQHRIKSQLDALEGTYPSLKEMAANFSIHERRIRRALDGEGVSYQALVDSAKQDRAKILLANERHSVEYVAHALGYADKSNFRKAFKRWTGLTPSAYRDEQKKSPSSAYGQSG